ncbi:MAG: type II toxin-antitoxin system HicB family antitoxin [Blautia sp.]|nr:type II toxin-antitoxin system HicB family antitoxin [Blautia sp.]
MKKPDYYLYPAVFKYSENEDIAILFPDLDVATSGENEIDALKSARELLGITMFGLEEDGDPIPAPSSIADLKCEEAERSVLVDVYMPSIRLANVNKSVNRTVTLPAWLNALAIEHNINFSHLLQSAIKQQLNI